MKKNLPRRNFLRGVGAAMALPSLESFGGPRAAPNAAAIGKSLQGSPLRLLCLFQPNGVYPAAWDVKGEGRDYQLSPILRPLEEVREHVSVISGLDNSVGGGHPNMTAAFLTGSSIRGGRCKVSLDQKVAKHYQGQTRFPSVVLGTEPPRQGGASGVPISMANTVSWSSETTRVSPEINPRVAFDRLFRATNDPVARKQAMRRRSVVDLVLEDAQSLRRNVSHLDQHKIDEYLDSVRSVEMQIEDTLNPAEREWTPPTSPSEQEMAPPPPGLPRERDVHLKLMMDLLVLTLWTDTARVGTLMTAHGFSRQNFSFLEGVKNDHHGMSHHKENPEAVAEYTTVSRWYIKQFAYLLERMRSIDEGDGSLLDNSILVYGSGMKDGNGHRRENLPILLAGGGKGSLNPGRHIQVKKQPLANLHLSLAQRFGIESGDFNEVGRNTIDEL